MCLIFGPMLASQPCSHAFWVLTSLHLLSFQSIYFLAKHRNNIHCFYKTADIYAITSISESYPPSKVTIWYTLAMLFTVNIL